MFDFLDGFTPIEWWKDSWREASEEIDNPKLSRGAVIRVELARLSLIGFDHFGIYAGQKKVIHFSKGVIRKDSLREFIEGAGVFNANDIDEMTFSNRYTDHISLEYSYRRAKSCLGMTGYNVINCNCEHFALWCRTGRAYSGQAFGSNSDKFEFMPNSCINIPREIGKICNELEMKKRKTIFIDNLQHCCLINFTTVKFIEKQLVELMAV